MQGQLEKQENPVFVLAKGLIFGAIIFVLGMVAYLMTDKFVWLGVGIVGDLAFVGPAVLKFVRLVRERSHASG